MFRNSFLLISFSFLLNGLWGCSTSPIKVKVEEADFKVMDAAPGGREAWLDNPQVYAEDKGYEVKENYFYVGEAKSPDKRMACEKAHANVMDDISKQIAVFTDTSISRASAESAQSDSGQSTNMGQVSEETQKISAQLSKAQLSNIMVKKSYWERRDYSQGGGAKNLTYCWVLVYVSKKDVNNLVSRATTMRLGQNEELKEKVEKKLENIDQKYEQWQRSH